MKPVGSPPPAGGTEFVIWLSEAGAVGEVVLPGCVGVSTVPPVAVELGEIGAGMGAALAAVVGEASTAVMGAARVYWVCAWSCPKAVFARTV